MLVEKFGEKDEKCLTKVRFPNGVHCLNCDTKRKPQYHKGQPGKNSRGWYYCPACTELFSCVSFSLFEGTQRSLQYWIYVYENLDEPWTHFKGYASTTLSKTIDRLRSIKGMDLCLIKSIQEDEYFNDKIRSRHNGNRN